ncbi:hypothetical protein [Amycolatopsis sp. NPDC051371]|uniref:hypothetical protein n=1 Tax=Amycolatopsis sp. NPDC051371 TaxID=3155800 RepID=UPI00341808F9
MRKALVLFAAFALTFLALTVTSTPANATEKASASTSTTASTIVAVHDSSAKPASVESNAYCKEGNTSIYQCPWMPDCGAANDGQWIHDDNGQLWRCEFFINFGGFAWYSDQGCLAPTDLAGEGQVDTRYGQGLPSKTLMC